MRTKSYNVYKFDELSEEAKERALDSLRNVNFERDWWDVVYEDAKNIGLEIIDFDLEGNACNGKLVESMTVVADNILREHGESCDTYEIAVDYKGEPDDFEGIFLIELLRCYLGMLKKEYEYLTSTQAIVDTINANEYEFTEDGKID